MAEGIYNQMEQDQLRDVISINKTFLMNEMDTEIIRYELRKKYKEYDLKMQDSLSRREKAKIICEFLEKESKESPKILDTFYEILKDNGMSLVLETLQASAKIFTYKNEAILKQLIAENVEGIVERLTNRELVVDMISVLKEKEILRQKIDALCGKSNNDEKNQISKIIEMIIENDLQSMLQLVYALLCVGEVDYVEKLTPNCRIPLKGLPFEIKKFDKKSAQIFASLLEEESYSHFESRVMLAGEPNTGKTTIARYLVGKRPTKVRLSTDGIDLYNGLAFMDRASHEWLGGQQDFSLQDITVGRSLLREDKGNKSVRKDNTRSSNQDVPVMEQDTLLQASEGNLSHESIEKVLSNATPEGSDFDGLSSTKSFISTPRNKDEEFCTVTQEKILHSVEFRKRNEHAIHNYPTGKEIVDNLRKQDRPMTDSNNASWNSGNTSEMHIENVTKPGIIRKLKHLFGVSKKVSEVRVSITKDKFLKESLKVGKKLLHHRKIAPIIIWDFGGQDVFYSTHQTFLTYRAIYMIVLDGSRKLDDICPYGQYLPGKTEHKTARDYLRFWINTIVTYCKGSIQGFPKIMIVLSHKDKVPADGVEHRRHELFIEISQMFEQTPLKSHLVIESRIFVNATDQNDPEMAKIKAVIISESTKQPTWGESLPKCFIPLELEFASLIGRNIPLITLEQLLEINSLQPIRPLSESELKVFLKFQHSIGKVLYFDEHKLDSHVILSPSYLIDAFKSIVTDRSFCQGDKEREELCDVMGKKGIVSKHAIQQIWKKKKYQRFFENKDYLLDVMTHLDILVEPKRYDTNRQRKPADFFYVTSMVRARDDSGYRDATGFSHRSISMVFQSSSSIIPPALSFRFISYCLYVWDVKTYGQNENDMLFHRSGVFTIDRFLDLYITCEDEMIIACLVHGKSNTLIMRDVASSIHECLTSVLEKISEMYIRTSSDQTHTSDTFFMTRICCNSQHMPCIFPIKNLANKAEIWICPNHGIEHNTHAITSWIAGKDEETCKPGCPVTNEVFLEQIPSDLHLRRLALLYSTFEAKKLTKHFGWSNREVDAILENKDQMTIRFEILRHCRDSKAVTFKDIKEALEIFGKENIHILCKLVKGKSVDTDEEPEKWDLVPTEEHIDRLAPLIGKQSLPFLIELGLEFHTWEQIRHRQNEKDLVRLNKDILEEWRFMFCRMHNLKPSLRTITRAFSNIGKNIKVVENALSDLF